METGDEFVLRLRYTGRGWDCAAPPAVVMKRAVKMLKRRFGLEQYKRGTENPPEVIVVECECNQESAGE